MKEARIFWGDLPLWRLGRMISVKETRGGLQAYEGIDALNTLVLPTSPNFSTELECHTLFDPYADASGDYTRASFRATVDAMLEAITLRSYSRAPVCWIEDYSDTTVNRAVTNVSGSTLTVGTNSFANNDWVLVRRLGVGLWTLSQVSNRTSTTVDVTLTHAATTSDEVLLVSQFWKNMVCLGMGDLGFGKDGGHYAEDAVYTFKGTCPSTARYRRLTVDLDS